MADSPPVHDTPRPPLATVLDAALRDGRFGAAVVLAAVDGHVVASESRGVARVWDAPGEPFGGRSGPVTPQTRFDLASVTKSIVAAAVLAELHARGADASAHVADVLPEFRSPDLRSTTFQHLLSHTAGFAAEWLDRSPDPGAVRFRAGARPEAPPGARHVYSCIGYIWAGLAGAALAGVPLAALVRARVLEPVGMTATDYRPQPRKRGSIPATEFQNGRGMVQGEVHDETAHALGGVSGNAGLFGSASDLLRFAEALRTGGRVDGDRVLPAAVVAAMVADSGAPVEADYRQGLGVRLDESWMRGLGPRTAGHTGFTGTCFATEPDGRGSIVFLANRVHPTRETADFMQVRARAVDAAARIGENA